MEAAARLERLKDTILKEVADSAKHGNIGRISKLIKMAEECERALAQLQATADTADRIERQLRSGPEIPEAPSPDFKEIRAKLRHHKARRASAKARGKAWRAEYVHWLRDQHGITLHPRGGLVYTTASDRTVAIPTASELSESPDKWWLGLPDESFDVVVLLCFTEAEERLDFVLPRQFLLDVWGYFSRDKRENVKFNVSRHGRNYSLLVPGDHPASISEYLGNHEPLK